MSSKNVLFVAVNFFCPEYLDGGNKIIYNLLKQINKEQQPSVHFYSLNPGEMEADEQDSFNNISFSSANTAPNSLLFKIKKALNWLLFHEPRIKLPKTYAKKIAKKIQALSKDYDCIHLTSLTLANVADYLPQEIIAKTVLSAVDCYSMYTERKLANETSVVRKILGKMELKRAFKYEKKYYPKFKSVIFVSDVDKAYALEHFQIRDNLNSIPLGVDTDYFAPAAPSAEEENTVIFTGNMSYPPNKDASLFLVKEVLPLIQIKNPTVKIILAGSNPPHELLELRSNKVEITGRVPDLRTYIHKAGLFVCPLRFGAGMKYKILEAMALEKEILCSELSVDGIQNETISSCHVLKDFSPEEWANKIVDLLAERSNSGRPRNLDGRKLIQEIYSWKAMKDQYAELYR